MQLFMPVMYRFFIFHITGEDLINLQTIGALLLVIVVGMECFLRGLIIGI